MTKVAVSGACGALGQKLLKHLVSDPMVDSVTAIDRGRTPAVVRALQKDNDHKLEIFRSDLAAADLKELLEDCDSLVHLAWSAGPLGGAARVPLANLTSLSRTLDAAAACHVKTFIFLSSATVYGAWPDNAVPLSEDADLRANEAFPFAVQKAKAESLIEEWRQLHPQIRTVILRPTVILSETGESQLAKSLGGAKTIRVQGANQPVQFVHVDDVCSAVMLALHEPLSGAFNVAPDGFIRDGDARELAGGAPNPAVPKRFSSLLKAVAWRIGLVEASPGVSPYREHPWVIANDKLRKAGWVPRYTNQEALVTAPPASFWGSLNASQRRKVIGAGFSTAAMAAIGGLYRFIKRH